MIEPNDLIAKLLGVVQQSDLLKEEEVEPFYSYAFAQYQSGCFERAADVFHVLCARKPLETRFWFGLAATLQEKRNYEKALSAWAMTALLDPINPYPHFHAAECSLSLNNISDAKLALKESEQRIGVDILGSDKEQDSNCANEIKVLQKQHPLHNKIHLLKEAWGL